MWRTLRRRFIARDRYASEIKAELEFHVQMRADELQEGGLPRPEALRQARVELGNPETIRQDVRNAGFGAWIEPLFQDVRFGLRMLRKRPGVTLIGAASLAVGIGVCTFFFSQFNAMVLRPLPGARAPGELAATRESFSYPTFERFRELEAVAEAAAYIGPVPFNVAFENESGGARVFGHLVSPDYFSVLGVVPAAGRFFSPEIERTGSEAVVVVSDPFWRRRLNADPEAVGRTLRVNGRTATIVGVAPDGFRGVFPVNPADLFVPVTAGGAAAPELQGDVLRDAEADRFQVVARLASGVSMAAAEAALDTVARGRDAAPAGVDDESRREGRQVTLLHAGRVGRLTTQQLWLVVGLNGLLVALVLSLACANLAGLLIARAEDRRREMAFRFAVGAGRGRLIRQLLTECVMLALAGGAAGVVFSWVLVRAAESVTAAAAVPFEMNLRIDPAVGLFVAAVAVAAGVGIGLAPAFAATRSGVTDVLRNGFFSVASLRGYRRFGFRNLFVGYQVAVSVMLLLVVGYLVIGFQRFSGIEPGFDTAELTMFEIDPARDGYSPPQAAEMLEEIPERLEALGAVAAAAVAGGAPLGDVFGSAAGRSGFRVSAAAPAGGGPPVEESVARQRVGAGYFAALGIPVVRGREFAERDDERPAANDTTPTPAVVNRTLARRLFGGDGAVGQPLRSADRRYVVVGVVQDSRSSFLDADPAPTMFLPFPGTRPGGDPPAAATVLVRGVAGPDSIDAARRELARFHPDLTLFNVRTVDEHLERFDRMIWFNSGQFGGLGLFGLALASIGLASVTAHAVARRRKEIGIRRALGARRADVLRLVLREGAVLAAAGAVFGCAGAFLLARSLSSLLADFARMFAASAGDPLLLVGVPALLVGITFLFCCVPALRAAGIEPASTLRAEQ